MTRHDLFEWDETKAQSNLVKHGITFEDAALALASDRFALEDEDHRVERAELRMVSVSRLNMRLLTVVWTKPQPDVTRIISARRATRTEWQNYEQRFQ